MHAALSYHHRITRGQSIACALVISVLLHIVLFLATGQAPHAPTQFPAAAPVMLQVVLEHAPSAGKNMTLASASSRPNGAMLHTRPKRISRPSKAVEPVEAPTPVRARPIASPAPALTRAKHARSAPQRQQQLSAQSLLQQVDELSSPTRAEAPAQSQGHLVYGRSATGVLWTQYMDDWVRKMERLGALNYPEEVRRQALTGGPLLSVVINADGSLRALRTVRSSGNPTLDAAASNLVRSAAPFAPFPPGLSQQASTLEIKRKWTFSTDNDVSVH